MPPPPRSRHSGRRRGARALSPRAPGATCRHSSVTRGQRPANTQPAMRALRLGTLPGISASLVSWPVSEEPSFGTAPSSPCV